MKKILKALAYFCSILFLFTGCSNVYNEEEVLEIKNTFASFDNKENFALQYFDRLWLPGKEKIMFNEITYQGVPIDRLFGCENGYGYLSTRTQETKNNYTIHLLQMSLDSLEIQEIGCVENLKDKSTTACRVVNGKLYFSDNDKYCIYDIKKATYEWYKYEDLDFWAQRNNYSFKISNSYLKNQSIVTITDNQTGIKKKVSWKDDLKTFSEGNYILQLEVSTFAPPRFVNYKEKDGVIYLLGWIPLDIYLDAQTVIFRYDFETESLSYYSSLYYDWDEIPELLIFDE